MAPLVSYLNPGVQGFDRFEHFRLVVSGPQGHPRNRLFKGFLTVQSSFPDSHALYPKPWGHCATWATVVLGPRPHTHGFGAGTPPPAAIFRGLFNGVVAVHRFQVVVGEPSQTVGAKARHGLGLGPKMSHSHGDVGGLCTISGVPTHIFGFLVLTNPTPAPGLDFKWPMAWEMWVAKPLPSQGHPHAPCMHMAQVSQNSEFPQRYCRIAFFWRVVGVHANKSGFMAL